MAEEKAELHIVGRIGDKIFELSDGRLMVVGEVVTEKLDPLLPMDASRADYEQIVVIGRKSLIQAKPSIPGISIQEAVKDAAVESQKNRKWENDERGRA